MEISWENDARILYKNHPHLNKAIAAGRAIDNQLKCEYSPSGITKCRFDSRNYLAYFDTAALKRRGLDIGDLMMERVLQHLNQNNDER